MEFIQDNKQYISTVFGSIVGEPGGRPIPHSVRLTDQYRPDEQKLRDYVSKLNSAGITFNLAMNASCHGNKLLSDDGKAWLKNQVDLLRALNIEWVTVSSFDLARRISTHAPEIKILLSVMFNITSIDAVAYAIKQDFNFSGMIIGKGIFKQTTRLRRLLRYLDRQNLRAIVIANDLCPTGNCPERMSDHNNSCAHFHTNPSDYVSPSIHCRRMAMNDPAHFLQASIVNPNDIPFYEELGVRHFKLTDRVMPDETLIQVCRAYFAREYEGNLFDLFTYTSYLGEEPPKAGMRLLTDKQLAEIYLGGYIALKANRPYFVCQPFADARVLSAPGGFFKYFADGRCTMECGSRALDIPGCTYCEEKAAELLRYDQEEWQAVRSNIDRYISLSRRSKADVLLEYPGSLSR